MVKHTIRAKERCAPEYRPALIDAKQGIAEAVHKDNYWSSGLPIDLIRWTRIENWPGNNMMCNLHMELRDDTKSRDTSKGAVEPTSNT